MDSTTPGRMAREGTSEPASACMLPTEGGVGKVEWHIVSRRWCCDASHYPANTVVGETEGGFKEGGEDGVTYRIT